MVLRVDTMSTPGATRSGCGSSTSRRVHRSPTRMVANSAGWRSSSGWTPREENPANPPALVPAATEITHGQTEYGLRVP